MSTPTAILYVVDRFWSPDAGTEGQLLELIRGLDPRRFQPHFAVYRQTRYLSETTSFPCPVHDLRIPKLASPRVMAGLAGLTRLVTRLKAPIVHIYFNDASMTAPPFCRLAGARVLVSRRDMGFWYTPAILAALKVSNRFVETIVANSDAVRQNVHKHERYPLSRIAVIPNGHDPRRFDQPAEPRLRERLGIAPGAMVIGMVANLYARKRQADLVRALEVVRQSHDAHLILVGSGEDRDPLARLASDLGLGARVHILSGVSNAVPIIKHFDVAVLCSDSEGLSNAIIEYAFCGRPIVCTDVGGNSEIIGAETGQLVERGDVNALAVAIVEFLSSPARSAAIGESARRLATARYGRDAMLSAYSSLYDRIQRAPSVAQAG